MKIFISWSGDESKDIALILKEWIPSVIQVAEPYVSSEDIDKGARWASDISKELDDSSFGIICLTKSNLNAPWINFEAGALGKKVADGMVCPFLYKIKPSEISGPILQFQSTNSDHRDDVFKLIKSINNQCGKQFGNPGGFLKDDALERGFNQWWPVLVEQLLSIKNYEESLDNSKKNNENQLDNISDVMENILEITRSSHQLLIRSEHDNAMRHERFNPALLADLFGAFDYLIKMVEDSKESSQHDEEYLDQLEQCIHKFTRPINHLRRQNKDNRRIGRSLLIE